MSDGPAVHVPERFNAAAFFVDRNLEEGDGARPALLYAGETLSYDQVARAVNRAGNALAGLGVEIENRVAIVLPDSPEWVAAFFGAMKIGAVPVPVNTLLTADDYVYILRDSRAKVLVISDELLAPLITRSEDLPYLRHLLVVAPRSDEPASVPVTEGGIRNAQGGGIALHDFAEICESASENLDPAGTSRDDVAFWLYTSGTTGAPSAAVHLHHDMVFCLELYAKGVLGIGPEDRSLSVAKLFFAYGLGNSLYCPFGVGGTAILHPGRALPESVVELINVHRPTLFYGVPTWYAATLQALDRGLSLDASSIRWCVSAGEPLSANLYERWLERTGAHILDGIGTTEVLHIFLSNQPHRIRPGSTGLPVPGYEVKLVNDDGSATAPGDIGNLMVRGDSTCAAYWNKHQVTRQAIEGEWIKTRDKYHVDEDGYFWYEGRTNDMLKVGGRWVSPAEVEGAVAAHPAVLECAVVGILDDEKLERPKAFVVLKEGEAGGSELADDIQEFVKTRLAVYKYPREIEFIETLPKTATGKIQRFKLRA